MYYIVKYCSTTKISSILLQIQVMSHSKSNTTFIIFKAYSEENEPVDPYLNILKNQGYETQLIPTLEFEYHNFDTLNHKLQKPQDYSG